MKVFFNASVTGKKEYLDNYKKICEAIESSSMDLLASPVITGDKKKIIENKSEEVLNYYKLLQKWIKKADVCVFEVSFPSTSIGHEIALALNASKPVVALHVDGAPKNIILESITDERFQLIDYSMNDVTRTVEDALEYASENMDTRFNFFVSPQISNYLDWYAKENHTPRAVFIRQLIEKDMKKQGYID